MVEEDDGGMAVVGSTAKEEAEERRERKRETNRVKEKPRSVGIDPSVCGRLTRVMAASLSVPERTKGKQRVREGRWP